MSEEKKSGIGIVRDEAKDLKLEREAWERLRKVEKDVLEVHAPKRDLAAQKEFARQIKGLYPSAGKQAIHPEEAARRLADRLARNHGFDPDPTRIPKVSYAAHMPGYEVLMKCRPSPGNQAGGDCVAVIAEAEVQREMAQAVPAGGHGYAQRSVPLNIPSSRTPDPKPDWQREVDALRQEIVLLRSSLTALEKQVKGSFQKPAVTRGEKTVDPWKNEGYASWHHEDEDGLEVGYNGFPKPRIIF